MRKLLVSILAALTLGGCGESVSNLDAKTAAAAAANVIYMQDKKTGLCFAVISPSGLINPFSSFLKITWVPCEPKVLEQIKK